MARDCHMGDSSAESWVRIYKRNSRKGRIKVICSKERGTGAHCEHTIQNRTVKTLRRWLAYIWRTSFEQEMCKSTERTSSTIMVGFFIHLGDIVHSLVFVKMN